MPTEALHFLLLTFGGWVNRRQLQVIDYLLEENRVLREQLGPKRPRLNEAQRRRLAIRGKKLGRKMLSELGCIVTPDTLLGWYRRLVANKYNGAKARRKGRPPVADDVQALILRMAKENRSWGYDRVVGAMANLGHAVSKTTVKRILEREGISPSPERDRHLDWGTFLRTHWDAIAAADFFNVEVLTGAGLVRYQVLFVIELCTRRVHIAGISHDVHGAWMAQIGRNLTDAFDGFLLGKRYLLVDRDPMFTPHFRRLLGDEGVEVKRLPASSPNLNGYAERFIGSMRRECLDKVIPLGEAHLRKLVTEYVEHYNRERNHQGIGNALLDTRALPANTNGSVRRHRRLGGLLSYYAGRLRDVGRSSFGTPRPPRREPRPS